LVPNHIGKGIFSQYGALPADHSNFTAVWLKKQNYLFFTPRHFLCSIKNVLAWFYRVKLVAISNFINELTLCGVKISQTAFMLFIMLFRSVLQVL